MSKLVPDTNNKISKVESPIVKAHSNKIPEKIILSKTIRTISFSFKKKDKERLFELIEKIQNASEKKITATDILRGLLIAGSKMKDEELLECIQKSFIE